MKTKFTLVAVGVLAFSAALQASTSNYTFDFDNANNQSTLGGALLFTDGGITATVKAYSSSDTTDGGSLTAGYVGQYSGWGLGICDHTEGANCNAPSHQIDDQSQDEFLVITFSSAVDLTNLTIKQYSNCGGTTSQHNSSGCNGTDMDLSYWTASTSLTSLSSITSAGITQVNCGGTGQPACNAGGQTDSLTGQGVKTLIISAGALGAGDTNLDFFKLQSLNVSVTTGGTTQTTTPEPASLVLLGSGLLAGAVFGRRRRSKKSNS